MARLNPPIITLTSDFGLNDHFVGALKGVLLRHLPEARLIDVTHLIPKHDVISGAFVIREISGYFPQGTVHLAVVDPGVGTARRKLVVEQAGQFFVAPDNGLLSYLLKEEGCHVYEVKESAFLQFKTSPTFAGRDHFAPIAASLGKGRSPEDLGQRILDVYCIEDLFCKKQGNRIAGKIVYFDHFGNAVTNLSRSTLRRKLENDADLFCADLKKKRLHGLKNHYTAGKEAKVGLLINSSGFLEIFAFCDSAKKILNLSLMDDVFIP